ncbi:MAG TPA: methyl-accepting chemotaxis protein [Magnetospirillum sp.]|nr:methyl-accepting chemotaxis protein [Magnetospirillum sp.]
MLKNLTEGARSLTGKFILCSIGLLTAIFLLEIFVISTRSNTVVGDLALRHSREVGAHHASNIENELNRRMASVEAVSRAFAMMRRNWVVDRGAYNGTIRAMMEDDKSLFSLWAVFEPGAIDNDSEHPDDIGSTADGRFSPLWHRQNGQLVVDAISDVSDKNGAAEFYTRAMQSKKPVVTEPYLFTHGKDSQLLISLVSPVVVDRRPIGVVGISMPLTHFAENLGMVRPLDAGTVSLMTNNGNWAAISQIANLGKAVTDSDPSLAAMLDAVKGGQPMDFVTDDRDDRNQKFLMPITIGSTKTPWSLLVSIPVAKVFEPAAAIRNVVIGGKLLALVVLTTTLAVAGMVIVRRPLARTLAVIERLARGDYTVEVIDINRRDEIGQVNRALKIFQGNLLRVKNLEEERRLADEKAKAAHQEEMRQLADTFEAALSGISNAVNNGANQLQSNASTLTDIADTTSSEAQFASQASEQANINVQSVASAVTELVASVEEISRQIHSSADIAGEAVNKVDHTNLAVEKMMDAARRIGDVTGFIQKIAAQTNLLALNATIEAARAAEAGKGFAVVAGEVKNLASQTAKATEDIREQIQQMQNATAEVADAIHAVGAMISTMSENINAVASAAGQQGATTSEISRNLQMAADKTMAVASNVSRVTRATGEAGHMAQDVLHASQALSGQADALEREVRNFIDHIRAG